jgi:uncharacterized protein YjbJ (UPF0337 family)
MPKDTLINKDVIEGNWKEISGNLKQQWGKLTDDDLMRVNGSFESLGGILQQKYGYHQEEAKREVESFLNDLAKKLKN